MDMGLSPGHTVRWKEQNMQQYVKYSPLCKNEGNKETYLRKKHWKKKQKNVNYKDKEQ